MYIIPLNNQHSEEIISLILPIQQQEFRVAIDLAAQPDLLDVEGFYIRSGGNFWGAFDGSRLIGTIALIATGHGTGVVRKMFVHSDYRGKEKGIGQQLLNVLLDYSRQQHYTALYLGTVSVMKAAHRFYERNNFMQVSVAALPDYFPRMAADDVFYTLTLIK